MIETFGREMIEEYIRSADWRFLVDEVGNFVLNFDGGDGPDFRVYLAAHPGDVLFVRVITTTPYPRTLRDRLEAFVMGWNQRTRWPKAFLEDDRRSRGLNVVGENSYPLADGVHRPMVGTLIGHNMYAARDMLGELVQAVDTSTVDDLETWLHRTA